MLFGLGEHLATFAETETRAPDKTKLDRFSQLLQDVLSPFFFPQDGRPENDITRQQRRKQGLPLGDAKKFQLFPD